MTDKRTSIFETALRLFTERGFHGAPTSRIAQEAGIGTGTLFHYFKTKETLINQLYLEIKTEMVARMANGVQKETNVHDKLHRVWTNAMAWGMQNPSKFTFCQQFASSHDISAVTREEAAEHFGYIVNIIEEGRRQRILKDLPPEMMNTLIGGMLQGAFAYFHKNPDAYRNPELVEATFTLLWHMIRR